MAEKGLGGLGAGFMLGRATQGNRRLDQTVDRFEGEINKFADMLQRMTGVLDKSAKRVDRGSTGGYTSQSTGSLGNGGSVTFGGAHAPGSHRAEGEPRWTGGSSEAGKYRAENGGGATFGGLFSSGGGAHSGGAPAMARGVASSAYHRAGGRSGIAGKAGAVGLGGLAVYTANHAESQTLMQTAASQYAFSQGGWQANAQAMFGRNYTGHSTADIVQAGSMLAARGGFLATTNQFGTMRSGAEAVSLGNPAISNATAMQAQMSLGTVGSFNRMQALGITTTNRNGSTDIRSIALQILQKVPGYRQIRDARQIAAAMGQTGGISLTIADMVAEGYIPAESESSVRQAIMDILKAQIKGVNAQQLRTLQNKYQSNDRGTRVGAREDLQALGIADSGVQAQREKEGAGRATELETIRGFHSAVVTSTDVLVRFREALNAIMGIPGVGEAVGWSSGIMSTSGGFLSKIPGLGFLGGGGASPNMSAASYSYGAAGVKSGGPVGGQGMAGQSGGGGGGGAGAARKSGGGGGGPVGSSGLSFIAPRPGLNSMSAEQDYGPRTIGQGFHTGIDLQGGTGDPIKASAGGSVVGAGWGAQMGSGYGNVVVIDHGGGYRTYYAHMQNITVARGAQVRQGQTIGTVGDTGSFSRGSHLHFELHINGKHVDPVPYLNGRRGKSSGGPGNSKSGSAGAGTGSQIGSSNEFANGSLYGTYSEADALGLGDGGAMSPADLSSAGAAGPNPSTRPPGSPGGISGWGKYNLGDVKPWVGSAASLLGQKYGINSILGVGSRGNVSDHPKGLALDFMTSGSAGDRLAAEAVKRQHQLNVEYVIWKQKIWSDNNPSWRQMEDRGSPTANHMDHVHVSFESSPTNPRYPRPGAPGGGGSNGGGPAANIALGRRLAAARGWTGEQWRDLRELWNRESNWRTSADNPTSSAYGIPQAMTSLHNVGDKYMSGDARAQIMWGLNYIKDRYGNPSAALNYHDRNNSYAKGAWRIDRDQNARIHEGEMLLPNAIADAVRGSLSGGSSGGGQGAQIVFEPGSVVVQLSGPVSRSEARDAGKSIVDAVIADRRLTRLAEGRS